MTQKELRDDILDGTKSWNKEIVKGVPLFFLYYYFPKEESTNQYNEWARELIWNFKDGQMKYQCATMVTKVLQHFFLKETLASLTFICIPASTKKNNIRRYRDFSNRVTENCNMQNGYDHVSLKYEKEAKHLSGKKDFDNLEFDSEWFRGRSVIIFDDVVTSGSSIYNLKRELEKMGAKVIGAIALGRTVHECYEKSPYNEMDKKVKPEPPKKSYTVNSISDLFSSEPVDDNKKPKQKKIENTIEASVRLFNLYGDVKTVAVHRGLKEITIYRHLFSAGLLNPHDFITESEYKKASKIYDEESNENRKLEIEKFLDYQARSAFYYLKEKNSSPKSNRT